MMDPYDAALDPGSGVPIVSVRASETASLRAAAEAYRLALEYVRVARADLIEVIAAANEGGWSEYALCDTVDVSRATIRTWLGKGSR